MTADISGLEAPVAITPGASPYTYTAGPTAEVLFVFGGTVSSITLAGQQIAAATGVVIPLEANDSVVITYSAAPTVRRRVRS